MRVISGKARGKKLKTPENDNIRPTLDRVKENIFNVIGFSVRNAVVLDLFSGTGAIGIEALSRGAKQVYFVDKDKKSYELTEFNVKSAKLEDNAIILNQDAENALIQFENKGIKVDGKPIANKSLPYNPIELSE